MNTRNRSNSDFNLPFTNIMELHLVRECVGYLGDDVFSIAVMVLSEEKLP